MKKLVLFGGMFMMALASIGCVAGAEDEAVGDEQVESAEQALGSEFWIYAKPFTGNPGLVLPGCEVVIDAQFHDDFGGGEPVTVIGVSASKLETPSNYSWARQTRYQLSQNETINSPVWLPVLDACLLAAGVTPTANAGWYLGNFGQ